MVLAFPGIKAQNYLISFAGAGASNAIDSVKVENLSQCTSLTLAGTDILNLTTTVGMSERNNSTEGIISVYPNPSPGTFSIALESASDNKISFLLYDVSAKAVLKYTTNNKQGHHLYHLNGVGSGFYLLNIVSNYYTFTAKLISNAAFAGSQETPTIGHEIYAENRSLININPETDNSCKSKSVIDMPFNTGDTLKLTGKSGIYRTVQMLFPSQSQTVSFTFVKCTDADSNHYAVVQIGPQLWMQENLKATHYRDGSAIPNVTDSTTWGNLTSGAYCNFHNDSSEGAYYGKLYNYYAVADYRNIAPVGWHVATNSEWNSMEKFLDPTVDTTAWMGRGTIIGRILKENCDTRWAYLDTTWGWNCAGFTALCSNFRNNTGAWSLAPDNDHDDAFWTATSYGATTAWSLSLRWCFSDIYAMPLINKRSGQSVRCIKDY